MRPRSNILEWKAFLIWANGVRNAARPISNFPSEVDHARTDFRFGSSPARSPRAATWIITWNTGETSEWLYSGSTQNVSGTIVQTQIGVIVAGKFAGSTAIGVLATVAPPLIECHRSLYPPARRISRSTSPCRGQRTSMERTAARAKIRP